MVTLVYALLYPTGILKQVNFMYVTLDLNEAQRYSRDIFPGTIIVSMTLVPEGE